MTKKENFWLKKVPAWAPQIDRLFAKAENHGPQCPAAERHLFGAAWRMGLLRFLRTTHEEEIDDLLRDQIEPRYWWGSWEVWEAGKCGWMTASLAKPLDFSTFVKLCLAEEEIVRAATEDPGWTPDTSPLMPEEEDDHLLAIADSVEGRPLSRTENYAGTGVLKQRVEEVSSLWLQQRTRLSRREQRLAEQWVELVGWPPVGTWSPAWQWAPFLLVNFTTRWRHKLD